jgi:4-hydroxymandelate synthase
MTSQPSDVLTGLSLDHVTFYVDDVAAAARRMKLGYGFDVYATAGPSDHPSAVAVGANQIRLVLAGERAGGDAVAAYLAQHGDGIGDIAMRTADAAAAFAEAVSRGAKPVKQPSENDGVVTATIAAFGDVTHTFVQRQPGVSEHHLAGLVPVSGMSTWDRDLSVMDHFAVCVPDGQLTQTEEFYQDVLGFRTVFTEYVAIGTQAMDSLVVQNADRTVTFTVIAPDTRRDPGQIDEFLKNHGGPGVQHLALSTADIVRTVHDLAAAGVRFLSAPNAYYDLLADRIEVTRHPVDALRELGVLVDQDHGGQLFQIFGRSAHPRGTFFFEIIERLGARTFGSNNIKALYEALEVEMTQ